MAPDSNRRIPCKPRGHRRRADSNRCMRPEWCFQQIAPDIRSAVAISNRLMRDCDLSTWRGDMRCCRWCDGGLRRRQKKWCSDACRDGAYAEHYWSDARDAAVRRDGRRCLRCGADEYAGRGLQVHHRTEVLGKHHVTGCHHHVEGLETLCRGCHKAEHDRRRLRAIWQAEEDDLRQLGLWRGVSEVSPRSQREDTA